MKTARNSLIAVALAAILLTLGSQPADACYDPQFGAERVMHAHFETVSQWDHNPDEAAVLKVLSFQYGEGSATALVEISEDDDVEYLIVSLNNPKFMDWTVKEVETASLVTNVVAMIKSLGNTLG